MENAFHKLDHLVRETDRLKRKSDEITDVLGSVWEWVEYFKQQQEGTMATVEELKAKLPALDAAVRQVGDYVHALSQKVDEASEPHPAVQEMIDHVTGLTDALSRMVPNASAEESPEAAPEPSVSQQDASDMGMTDHVEPR